MKKITRLSLATLGMATVLFGSSVSAIQGTNQVKVIINGSEKTFDQNPILKEGRVFIPLRGVAETTGAKVTWDEQTKSVTIQNGDKNIYFKQDSLEATVNGEPYEMPASFKVNNRILVPIRFVSETLEYNVDWDKNQWAAVINTPLEMRLNEMIMFAEKFIGVPYLYGGVYETNQKFDCSSFTQYVYKHIGINLPRTSITQSLVGIPVESNALKKGDLLFFDITKDGVIDHVSIYINENKLFHSTSSLGVNYTGFTKYWKDSWVKSNRVIQ